MFPIFLVLVAHCKWMMESYKSGQAAREQDELVTVLYYLTSEQSEYDNIFWVYASPCYLKEAGRQTPVVSW
jgi:hypothetical protein